MERLEGHRKNRKTSFDFLGFRFNSFRLEMKELAKSLEAGRCHFQSPCLDVSRTFSTEEAWEEEEQEEQEEQEDEDEVRYSDLVRSLLRSAKVCSEQGKSRTIGDHRHSIDHFAQEISEARKQLEAEWEADDGIQDRPSTVGCPSFAMVQRWID